jgi:hypothetical protein
VSWKNTRSTKYPQLLSLKKLGVFLLSPNISTLVMGPEIFQLLTTADRSGGKFKSPLVVFMWRTRQKLHTSYVFY